MDTIWVVTKRDYAEINVILLFDGSMSETDVRTEIIKKYPRIEWNYSEFTNGKIGMHSEIDFYLMGIEKVNNV